MFMYAVACMCRTQPCSVATISLTSTFLNGPDYPFIICVTLNLRRHVLKFTEKPFWNGGYYYEGKSKNLVMECNVHILLHLFILLFAEHQKRS